MRHAKGERREKLVKMEHCYSKSELKSDVSNSSASSSGVVKSEVIFHFIKSNKVPQCNYLFYNTQHCKISSGFRSYRKNNYEKITTIQICFHRRFFFFKDRNPHLLTSRNKSQTSYSFSFYLSHSLTLSSLTSSSTKLTSGVSSLS